MAVPISGDDLFAIIRIGLPIAIAGAGLAARHWRFRVQWINNRRARDWTATSALIDVVSVAEERVEDRNGTRVAGYLLTLTYFIEIPTPGRRKYQVLQKGS